MKIQITTFAFILILCGCNNSSKNQGKIDVCRCLTEPGNTEYMKQNGTACDEAISKELNVDDWLQADFSTDKKTAKKYSDLLYKCTGKRPNFAEIPGVYSGIGSTGKEVTFSLHKGTFDIQLSDGSGSVHGIYAGTRDSLELHMKISPGKYELFGIAKITEEGLQIVGGDFFRRQ